ncbi:MAG: hypothetical protein WDN75_10875 [Bacteroidota bacterium]
MAIVCTSGSAAYNFAPAVAEAYFQHIPLIVFTATDRLNGLISSMDKLSGKKIFTATM